jgi:hypothetical protein
MEKLEEAYCKLHCSACAMRYVVFSVSSAAFSPVSPIELLNTLVSVKCITYVYLTVKGEHIKY